MKKRGILNSDISTVLSYMRHTDTLTVSDCGLPVPQGVHCIDLSVRLGQPGVMDVLTELAKDFKVEKVTMSEDIKKANPELLTKLLELYEGLSIEFVPHDEFKKMTEKSKAIIRTGENTLFANVILESACIF